MPFTDSDLRSLEPRTKKYRVAAGDGVYVEVHPHGGRYFVWVYCYRPGRTGQQRCHQHQIEPYGRGSGQWTLKAARDERNRLDLRRKAGDDPRALKADDKRAVEEKSKVPSLHGVAEDYLRRSENRQTTVNDYRNMLFNQVLPVLGYKSPVHCFERNNGGRQLKVRRLTVGVKSQSALIPGPLKDFLLFNENKSPPQTRYIIFSKGYL